MKKKISYLFLISALGIPVGGVFAGDSGGTSNALLTGVEHFKQATVKIQGGKIIYFDPFQINGEPHDGDIVLVTHTHSDHLSPADLKKVVKADTTVLVPEDGVQKVKEAGITKIIEVVPGKDYEAQGIKITTVPAYNVNKSFHPRANKWVGYIISINQARYYIAGDTDLIPEMKEIKTDMAFLPVGGTYTMTAEEAARAANLIKPKIAVPIHFGDVVGSMEDAEKFISLLDKGIEGKIIKK
ncbi:MAG TPA: MBL fold metallo-hydrolase [Bacillota bacterium]|nr:MBL fold metallo-hydrolase [Bacillota bacterium]